MIKKTIDTYVYVYVSTTRHVHAENLTVKYEKKNNSLEWDEKNVCRVRRVIYRRRCRHTYRRRGRIHGRFFILRPHQRCDITGYLFFSCFCNCPCLSPTWRDGKRNALAPCPDNVMWRVHLAMAHTHTGARTIDRFSEFVLIYMYMYITKIALARYDRSASSWDL